MAVDFRFTEIPIHLPAQRNRMPRNIELITPIKLGRFTRLLRIRHVDVSVHWSVLVISGVVLLGAFQSPLLSIIGLTSYLGVLLLHECGHLFAAQRLHCQVFDIELYPIFAITRFEIPWSRFDHCVIAWGGVLAQFIVAIPLVVWVALFGYTRFEAVNAALAIWDSSVSASPSSTCFPFARSMAPSPGVSCPHFSNAQRNRQPDLETTAGRGDNGSWSNGSVGVPMTAETRSTLKSLLNGVAWVLFGISGLAFWAGGHFLSENNHIDRLSGEILGLGLAGALAALGAVAKSLGERLEDGQEPTHPASETDSSLK